MSQQADTSASTAAVTTDAKQSLLDKIIEEQQASHAARYLPIMDVKVAVRRQTAIVELKQLVLVEAPAGTTDGDYGTVPGTKKPTLFKSGAEKLCSYFGYVPHYEIMEGSIEEWTDGKYGEPLFYYHVRCMLLKDGIPVGEGTGSCSSWESKYRFRFGERECPNCKKADGSLIKAKPEYEKGPNAQEYMKRGIWLCYDKRGGCGSKFFGDDPAIMGQVVGQVANDKIFDIVNTVQKMADKRAYVAATLAATGASQYFTQDMDDLPPQGEGSTEAQKKVADEKIAKLTDGKPAAAGTAKPASTAKPTSTAKPVSTAKPAGAPAAGSPAPQAAATPASVGAQPTDPPELVNTLAAYTRGNVFSRESLLRELHDALLQYGGTGEFWQECLDMFDVSSPKHLTTLPQEQEFVRAVWLTLARVINNSAPVPA